MARSCPLSFKQIDGTIARINAVFITLLVVMFLITSNEFILYFLAIDFLLRLSNYKSFSPIFNLSKNVKKLFSLKTNMTDAGAKRLAAYFGLIFIVLMSILSNLNLDVALYITATILLFCSSLEVLFNYCVGCEIYHIYKKLNYERS
jgi:hypothetical protein